MDQAIFPDMNDMSNKLAALEKVTGVTWHPPKPDANISGEPAFTRLIRENYYSSYTTRVRAEAVSNVLNPLLCGHGFSIEYETAPLGDRHNVCLFISPQAVDTPAILQHLHAYVKDRALRSMQAREKACSVNDNSTLVQY